MSWKLVQKIDAGLSNMDRAMLASIGEFASAYDAIRAAGIEMDAVEEKFVKGIPNAVWFAMAGSIAASARAGRRMTFDMSRGFGYSASVSAASSRSDVAIVLQAPEVFRMGSASKIKSAGYKTRSATRGKTAGRAAAKRKPAAKRATRRRSR